MYLPIGNKVTRLQGYKYQYGDVIDVTNIKIVKLSMF